MILYFSGTGNSRYVAKRMGEELGDEVVSVNERLKNKNREALRSQTPFVVVSPVYAWRLPRVVEGFILETAFEGNADVYFVLTCGGDVGLAGKDAKKLCAKKGLAYHGLMGIRMPENYIAMYQAPCKEEAREIIRRAKEPIQHACSLIGGKKEFPEQESTLANVLKSGMVNDLFYPLFVTAKGYHTTSACIGCGKCAALCPLNNIRMEGKQSGAMNAPSAWPAYAAVRQRQWSTGRRPMERNGIILKDKELYTIGEVGRICGISAKALRYYDKIGIISPDHISEENGYRYYSRETLLLVPVMKYYKQMGFKLEEMQELLGGNTYQFLQQNFHSKISGLKDMEREIQGRYAAVRDWYELVKEAELVIRHNIQDVTLRYINPASYYYMDQEFDYQYMESVINISWTNYLEQAGQRITGPVILQFPSMADKMAGTCARARIMQQAVWPDQEDPSQILYGGQMAACTYHVGDYDGIGQAY